PPAIAKKGLPDSPESESGARRGNDTVSRLPHRLRTRESEAPRLGSTCTEQFVPCDRTFQRKIIGCGNNHPHCIEETRQKAKGSRKIAVEQENPAAIFGENPCHRTFGGG